MLRCSFVAFQEGDVALTDNQFNLDGQTGSAKLVTIATQTNDVYLPSSAPLVQDSNDWHQSPGNQNLSALYHGGWPLENGWLLLLLLDYCPS